MKNNIFKLYMDSEKKPNQLKLLHDSIHELKYDIGSVRNDISYIKVALIQHIKSLEKREEIKKPEVSSTYDMWFFT